MEGGHEQRELRTQQALTLLDRMIEVEKEDDKGKREHAGPWGGPLIEEGGVGTSRTWERHLAMASVPAGSWLPSKGWE